MNLRVRGISKKIKSSKKQRVIELAKFCDIPSYMSELFLNELENQSKKQDANLSSGETDLINKAKILRLI